MSVDPQTQHFCTTNCDCAFNASGTSRVLHSPFVNNDFHKQGMDSRQLRDRETTASLADACAFKYTDSVARVTSRIREPTEKTREKICVCTAPAKLPAQSGQKENNPAARAQHRQKDAFGLHTSKWVRHTQGRERIRQLMFAAVLRTKHKKLSQSSKLTRCLIGHITTLYLTVRGSVRNDN